MVSISERLENSLILGDCLKVMSHLPDHMVDLIYIDPPFGTGRERKGENLKKQAGGRIRTDEEAEVFRLRDVWDGQLEGYLAWLRPRIEEMVRLLKPAGSLLVHLDWHASHYVKVMLDEIMGRQRFVNEIIWHYKSGGHSRRRLSRKFDSIFWYARGDEYAYNAAAAALPRNRCGLCGDENRKKNHMKRQKDENGRVVRMIKSAGKIYKYYEDDPAPPNDVWLDIPHLHQRDPERTGYPAQKPLKLLERLVLLCSRPGDVVGDFFTGTGTTLIAASRHGRRWLGCDNEADALRLAAERLNQLGLAVATRELGAE
jgi:site-specific DNA-methyltransferase (adenine-specific)/adenine-specific DNA-methyltransferase